MQLNEFPWAMLDRVPAGGPRGALKQTERLILFRRGAMSMREDAKPATARALHGHGKRRKGEWKRA